MGYRSTPTPGGNAILPSSGLFIFVGLALLFEVLRPCGWSVLRGSLSSSTLASALLNIAFVVGLWIGPAPSLSQRIRVACMGMVLPMCRFGTMRILTCITSGVNGKRIRTSSAMVARGSIQECCHRILVGASSCPFAMWLIWTTVPALQSDFRAADVLSAPTLHCKVSIFKAILTPGSAPEETSTLPGCQRASLRGLVPDPPRKRRSNSALHTHPGGRRLRDPLASGTA